MIKILDEIKGICKKNTLIVAFTNGIHKRNIFLEKRVSRKTIFLQYTDNFNMLSLINYFKFNKKENKKVNHNSVLQ
jgi:ketopantoate reductase